MVRYYLIFLTLFAPPDPLKGLFTRSDFAVRGEIKEEMIFLRKIRNGGAED